MLEPGKIAFFNSREEVRITEVQHIADGVFVRAVGIGLGNENVTYYFGIEHFKLTPHVEREVAQ